MALTAAEKESTIEKHRKHPGDRGSTEIQVALLTQRIADLTDHLREHPKDHHSRMGLLKWVGKRRRLLRYLSRTDTEAYRRLTTELGLRA